MFGIYWFRCLWYMTPSAHPDGNVLDSNGEIISPEELAKKIKDAGGKDGMPIEIRACGSGSGGNSAAKNLTEHFPQSTIDAPIGGVTPEGYTPWPFGGRLGFIIPPWNP